MFNLLEKLTHEFEYPGLMEDRDPNNHYPKTMFGYIRSDYADGRWWNKFQPLQENLESPELVEEFNSVYAAFCQAFPSLDSMSDYCESHFQKISETEFNAFADMEYGYYWFRMITREEDCNLYLHCFSKAEILARYKYPETLKYISFEVWESSTSPTEEGTYLTTVAFYIDAEKYVEDAKKEGKSCLIKGITPKNEKIVFI